MSNRNSTVILAVIIGACLSCIILVWAYYRPRVTIEVERELVGPEDERVWALLWKDAPLTDIKQAVRQTGKHPDRIVWVSGSLLSNAVDKQRKDLVVWLIEQGANPNNVISGEPPLETAILNEDPEMIRLLVEHGADPDLKLGCGMTPRSIAREGGNPAVIKALSKK